MTYRNRAAITALLVRAVPGAVTTAVLRGCNHGPDRLGRRPVHAAGWRSRGGTHQSHVLRCRAGPVDRHSDHGAVLSAGQRAPFPAPPKRGRLLPGGVAAARCSGLAHRACQDASLRPSLPPSIAWAPATCGCRGRWRSMPVTLLTRWRSRGTPSPASRRTTLMAGDVTAAVAEVRPGPP
jgi:hypothetical protein